MNKNTQGVVGLARRAGALEFGTNNVLDAIRSKKALLVIIAADVSDNTKKNIRDKAAFYSVKTEMSDVTVEELGRIIGKGGTAAIALTDENFVKAYRKSLTAQTSI